MNSLIFGNGLQDKDKSIMQVLAYTGENIAIPKMEYWHCLIGAPLKRTFTLAVTNISEMDFNDQITYFKEGEFSTTKYSQENNNGSHFAVALIKYLLDINHLEPELEEYLHPSNSKLHALQLMQTRTEEIMENGFPFQSYNHIITHEPSQHKRFMLFFKICIKILELKAGLLSVNSSNAHA
ncbi:uncharacterized protein LOC119081135 [Bradysia coprophila]|uniref:uncharacterized protein LOC119081135 n=1 Tax=Bradysia coprophila TaxID=38358 RepID=UPI00187DBEE6|nr:uncharacterized protein LOC119081135 [Bradysia coprophila]